ncbi:hypothetical protein RRG08_011866 [Elysia crispata]|uniref:Uncharacterized protein n=1 Tax=Elysia crispata TaxID=231223 RepID=A0AAE0ZM24_9GAST|nr:hypothetical protein RRG08_011866 [Elysia crispata]
MSCIGGSSCCHLTSRRCWLGPKLSVERRTCWWMFRHQTVGRRNVVCFINSNLVDIGGGLGIIGLLEEDFLTSRQPSLSCNSLCSSSPTCINQLERVGRDNKAVNRIIQASSGLSKTCH